MADNVDQPVRYGVYFTPDGTFGDLGASWLGWDVRTARTVAQPDLPVDLATATRRPRVYGFHATLKPPFQLADGKGEAALGCAVQALLADGAPLILPPLELRWLGGFLAILPQAQPTMLTEFAARLVAELDEFRAPMSAAELARRSKPHLGADHLANLTRWGYPHVMQAFRFHLTVTDRITRAGRPKVEAAAALHFAEFLDAPLVVDAVSLVKQTGSGCFSIIDQQPIANRTESLDRTKSTPQ